MSGTVHKEFKPLAAEAQRQGWTIEVTRKNHLRWRSPEGNIVISAGTPSCNRSVMETKRLLRRNGLAI